MENAEKPDNSLLQDDHARVKDMIINKIENGMTFKDACVLSGISEATGHRLKALQKYELERLYVLDNLEDLTEKEKEELAKLQNRSMLCEIFESRILAGIISYKEKLVRLVNNGALDDGKLALAVLRTRYPDDWNAIKKIEHSGHIDTGMKELAQQIQDIVQSDNSAVHNDGPQDNSSDTATH